MRRKETTNVFKLDAGCPHATHMHLPPPSLSQRLASLQFTHHSTSNFQSQFFVEVSTPDSQCSVPASLPPAPYYQLPSARLPHPKPCASLLVFPSPPRSHFGPSVQFLVPVSPSVLKPKYQLISIRVKGGDMVTVPALQRCF